MPSSSKKMREQGRANLEADEQLVHRRLVAMRQVPIEHVVHEAPRGVARVEIAEDHAAARAQLVICPIDERDRQLVAQIVDEIDAVDQVLGRQLQLLPAGGELDQVCLQRSHLLAERLLLALRTDVGQRLPVDIDAADDEAPLVVGLFEHVEDLARRTAGEAGNVEFLGRRTVGRQDLRCQEAPPIANGLGRRQIQHAAVEENPDGADAGRRVVVDHVDGLVVARVAARLGVEAAPRCRQLDERQQLALQRLADPCCILIALRRDAAVNGIEHLADLARVVVRYCALAFRGANERLELIDLLENAAVATRVCRRRARSRDPFRTAQVGRRLAQAPRRQGGDAAEETRGKAQVLRELALEQSRAQRHHGAGLDGTHARRYRFAIEPGDLADDLPGTQLADLELVRWAGKRVNLEETVGDEEDRFGRIVLAHQHAIGR